MKKFIQRINLSIFLVLLLSCTGKNGNGLLPSAAGRPGEMILVMDSSQWKGELGKELRNIFREEVAGLPRPEPQFTLNHVEPQGFNSVLKTVKNLVLVTTLDKETPATRILKGYFTKSSLEKIQTNPNLFVYTSADEYAKGQTVMYLFGRDEETLMGHLRENGDKLLAHFNNVEKKRLRQTLYKSKAVKGISDMLKREHQCSLKVPFGYQLAHSDSNFVWIRQIDAEIDKNLFIAYTDYRDTTDFKKENIIRLRDYFAKSQLFEDPAIPNSYIITETQVPFVPVATQNITFNRKFAVETRGLWKTVNLSMGGPFVSYTFVDESLNRLYYIEGFTYSPGKDQRETIRELETILWTFQVSGEIG